MKFLKLRIAVAILVTGACHASTVLTEGFDDVSALPGWLITNNSSPTGSTNWFQGNPGIFSSQTGSASSYAAANFLNAAPGGAISSWLISPVVTFIDGDTISFYSRTVTNPALAADRLELRLSTSGVSSDVGGTSSSVGVFAQELLTINPALSPTGYPADWTQFVATISGLGGLATGRFAFRYSAPDTNSNGDYIGVDTVIFHSNIPEPATVSSCAGGILGLAFLLKRRARLRGRTRP